MSTATEDINSTKNRRGKLEKKSRRRKENERQSRQEYAPIIQADDINNEVHLECQEELKD